MWQYVAPGQIQLTRHLLVQVVFAVSFVFGCGMKVLSVLLDHGCARMEQVAQFEELAIVLGCSGGCGSLENHDWSHLMASWLGKGSNGSKEHTTSYMDLFADRCHNEVF